MAESKPQGTALLGRAERKTRGGWLKITSHLCARSRGSCANKCRRSSSMIWSALGCKGLLEAAQRYDDRHGVAFTTFAYYRVRGAMFDGLRSMGWLPRSEYARCGSRNAPTTSSSHRPNESPPQMAQIPSKSGFAIWPARSVGSPRCL